MYHPNLQIKQAGPKGRGVFASAAIARGELIATFTGRTLTTEELTDDLFCLQIGPALWLCTHGEQLDDCINHSCEPNTGFVTGEPILYAVRDVMAGEELTFDYATSIATEGWTLECACGTPRCRKVILPWMEMPASFQGRMRSVALRYLRDGEYRLAESQAFR